MKRLLFVVAAILLWPIAGHADREESFRTDWETATVDKSPITFNVAGNPHFGMTSYRRRLSENHLAESHIATIQFSGYVMVVYAATAKGSLHYDYEPPSRWITIFSGFFKNGSKVAVRENGGLALSFRVEYSAFRYPFDRPADCAAFNGNSGGFSVGGFVCAPPGKDLGKADVERLLGAVGFPDFLEPKPLEAAP